MKGASQATEGPETTLALEVLELRVAQGSLVPMAEAVVGAVVEVAAAQGLPRAVLVVQVVLEGLGATES